MLVEANSKSRNIVFFTDGSVTRYWSGQEFTVKQGGRTVHEGSGAYRVATFQSDHGSKSSHTRNTVASFPTRHADYTCDRSHRLKEPAAKGLL